MPYNFWLVYVSLNTSLQKFGHTILDTTVYMNSTLVAYDFGYCSIHESDILYPVCVWLEVEIQSKEGRTVSFFLHDTVFNLSIWID